jgi:hypothetical protein
VKIILTLLITITLIGCSPRTVTTSQQNNPENLTYHVSTFKNFYAKTIENPPITKLDSKTENELLNYLQQPVTLPSKTDIPSEQTCREGIEATSYKWYICGTFKKPFTMNVDSPEQNFKYTDFFFYGTYDGYYDRYVIDGNGSVVPILVYKQDMEEIYEIVFGKNL